MKESSEEWEWEVEWGAAAGVGGEWKELVNTGAKLKLASGRDHRVPQRLSASWSKAHISRAVRRYCQFVIHQGES